MRICFISLMKGFAWGGSEELWCMVANHALQQGNTVMASVKHWDNLHANIKNLQQKGATLHLRDVPGPRSTAKPLIERIFNKVQHKISGPPKAAAADPFKGWQPVIDFKPDVVVINSGGMYDIIKYPELINVLHHYKLPYYLISQLNFENLPLPDAQRVAARNAFAGAKVVFFVSERNKVVAERNMVVRLNNSIIINNPMKLKEGFPVAFQPAETLRFASVARLDTKYKGQDILLQILAGEQWKNRNWELNFYGSGPDENYIRELITFYNLQDKVKMHSNVSDILSVWQYNHLLLMPSAAEGTPLSLIEAMFCGRTAVVTDVGGNADLIIDDQNGFLTACQSLASFGDGLERAWQQRDKLQAFGEQAYLTVKDKVNMNSYKTIYDTVTAA